MVVIANILTEKGPCFRMIKRMFLALMAAILVSPLLFSTVLAHSQDKQATKKQTQQKRQDKDDDDDDDDRPVFRPPALMPGEKPADADFMCPYAKGYQRPQRFESYTLRLVSGTKTPTDRCRATITSAKGKLLAAAKDWALTVDKISGTDINGDGKPDLVIAGYSGDARCCFTYTVVELGSTARTLRQIESRSALTFEKQPDGTVLIEGLDSSMDYFLVPHPMAVIPQVFLKMQGDTLVDVSAQFQPKYDSLIDEARAQLTSADIDKFRQSRYNDKMYTDQLPTVRRVLTIVVSYLYSGREEQAWKALEELWPASDENRVRNLIIERRSRGLLKQLRGSSTAKSTS